MIGPAALRGPELDESRTPPLSRIAEVIEFDIPRRMLSTCVKLVTPILKNTSRTSLLGAAPPHVSPVTVPFQKPQKKSPRAMMRGALASYMHGGGSCPEGHQDEQGSFGSIAMSVGRSP